MFRHIYPAVAGVFVLALVTGCGSETQGVRFFEADAYPQKLSEWGILRLEGERLVLPEGVKPYDLNAPLFTDYAQKLRAIYLPPGTSAAYRESEAFEFPVGTIISKTFFYPRGDEADLVKASYQWDREKTSLDRRDLNVIETRLLVRQVEGWDAVPYVWRGDDAILTLAGTLSRLTIELDDGTRTALPYIVPTRNECASCHATDHSNGAFKPIGPKARHLNRGYLGGPGNQLTDMVDAGQLTGLPDLNQIPASADPDGHSSLDEKARAYLDINCGHCHNPKGAADTSGLLLDAATMSTRALGICKPPIAAGQGTGGRAYSIVPGEPDNSIIIFRMNTDDPGSRMPELGRSLVHTEGVALVEDWIAGLGGECVEQQPGVSLTGD